MQEIKPTYSIDFTMGGYKFRDLVDQEWDGSYDIDCEYDEVCISREYFTEHAAEADVDTSKACYDDPYDGGVTGSDQGYLCRALLTYNPHTK